MSLQVHPGRPTRRPDIWLRKTDNEIAVYDPLGNRIHLLNDTALAIWELCDGDTEPGEMITAICELCNMHRDVVTEDVVRILDEFDAAGLIQWER
jgi:hypothetical protein